MRLFTIALVASCLAAALHADNLVVDRGLPAANLNDAAGSNRSNVAWGDYSPYNGLNWAMGDDFTINAAGKFSIKDLRVWIVTSDSQPIDSMWSDLRLFGGPTGPVSGIQQLSQVSTDGTDPNVKFTPVTYADGTRYQGSSGGFINIYQVDFLLNWGVDGLTNYSFFVGDTPTALNKSLYPPGVSPFLSASNAALGGAPHQGSDDFLHDIGWDATGVTIYESWKSSDVDGGWDKASDINVQVFATPEPGSILLLGSIALLAGSLARRKYRSQ